MRVYLSIFSFGSGFDECQFQVGILRERSIFGKTGAAWKKAI